MQGAGQRPPTTDLLDRQPFDFVVVLIRSLTGRVRRAVRLVSESGWPHRKCLNRRALGLDRSLDLDHVAVIKLVRLMDGEIGVGIFESDFSRGLGVSTGSHVERGVHLGTQALVVEPQREGVTVLLRRHFVDQLQRIAIGLVFVLFQNPGLDLAAAIRKHDPIEIIFDHRFGFAGGLLGGTRRGCALRSRGSRRRRHSCSRGGLGLRLRRRRILGLRGFGLGSGGLWPVLLQQGLEQHDNQEGQREDQQQPALGSGFLLRILKFGQIVARR